MKNLVCIIVWITIGAVSTAQETFVRVYEFPIEPTTSKNIQEYKDRIYTIANTACDLGEYYVVCSSLFELTANGDTLWMTLIPDIDVAPGSLVIVNDSITVTGNNEPLTAWRMAHFSLDGEKLGETMEIEHPQRKFTNMFQLTTQWFNNRFVICGSGWEGDTIWSLIYVVNQSGNIDTLITLDPADRISALWDSYIDSEGLLTTYLQIDFDDLPTNYRKIYKFDTNYDTVWTYRSENSVDNDVVPRGCELHDGRTLLSYTNPQQISYIHSVRAINSDGTKSWQYDYATGPYRGRYILRLKTLRNGDIMGCGEYRESQFEPIVKESPWLFRMSPDGELLWEHTYYEYDSTLESSRFGALFDFIELEDGDILAVGNMLYDLQSDMLIMRVDSNGCLNSSECDEVIHINTLTSTGNISTDVERVSLYPNPVRDILQIELESNTYQLEIEILNITGRIVANAFLTNGRGEVNTAQLPGGIYWISIKQDGRIMATGKFVKIE